MGDDSDMGWSAAQACRVLSLPAERFENLAQQATLALESCDGDRPRFARAEIARLVGCCGSHSHHHAVQFFEDDDFLCDVVSRYLSEGFEVDAAMVVIARPERVRAFCDALRAQGRDVDGALARGQLALFDAEQTLNRFMRNGVPQAGDFRAVIGPVVERGRAAHPGARLRAYGEMVDILWERGQPEAAIRLEGLWNELATQLPFSLLCGYRMANFAGEGDTERFARVCDSHSDVSPAESCTHPGKLDAHRREVARLQQRILSLESSVRRLHETEAPATALAASARRARRLEPDHRSLPGAMRILVVDDDAGARRLLHEQLDEIGHSDLQVFEAHSVTSALGRIEHDAPDLCICDFRLSPKETALDLFRAARARGSLAPFIGITGNLLEEELAETLLTAGFEDVLLKDDIDRVNLSRMLRNAALRNRNVRRLTEIGTVDEMTGTLNRRGFVARLQSMRQGSGNLSVLYLDLNDLKRTNDLHGHRAGDQLIEALIKVLMPMLRKCDAIGRLGGDEFCVALADTDARSAYAVIERLRSALGRVGIAFNGHTLTPSVSVGVCATAAPDELSAEAMIDRADGEMFLDKQAHKAARSAALAAVRHWGVRTTTALPSAD